MNIIKSVQLVAVILASSFFITNECAFAQKKENIRNIIIKSTIINKSIDKGNDKKKIVPNKSVKKYNKQLIDEKEVKIDDVFKKSINKSVKDNKVTENNGEIDNNLDSIYQQFKNEFGTDISDYNPTDNGINIENISLIALKSMINNIKQFFDTNSTVTDNQKSKNRILPLNKIETSELAKTNKKLGVNNLPGYYDEPHKKIEKYEDKNTSHALKMNLMNILNLFLTKDKK